MKTVMAALASLTFFVGLLIAPPAQAQKLQQVRIALSTPTPHMAPLYVGKDKKFYEKYGLDVQLILVNSGSLVAQMFASGELQMTANAPASLVNLAATGEKISFFLGLSNTSPFTVVTQPNLRRADDLKGKRIGTARFGGSSHISALIALEHLKLDLKRDKIVLIQTGVDPDRMVALETKAIDAGMLQRVATKVMVGKGYYPLLNMLQAKIPYQNTGLTVKKDYATASPKVIDGFTRATIEAYGYIFKKENKQAVKEVLARNLRLANLDTAEDFYLEAQEELDRKPYPSLEGFKVVIKYVAEQNPKAAAVKVEEIVDSSWLKKLDSEGFFEKVYGGK
ncbi:MAG TPA: ABC transporter substrate-binding protein [Candidatus Limnocylindrales bacterium]|nr:ABC transporter substrate-binding protein [Candidatus Limnocylindrales bacterium]